MISAINNRGTVRFMMYEQNMTARVLINFMKRLLKDAGRKVFFILDNLRVHHAKLVNAWLERNNDKIEVYHLPAYSPDLNPDEYLNNDLKTGIRSSSPSRSKEDLKGKVQNHMKLLQRKPSRVANYIRHSSIKYAA
jgi:transposase